MERLLHDSPDLSEQFMTFLISRKTQVESDLVDQLFDSSEKRLARIPLLRANCSGDGVLHLIRHVSQEALAARVGTTRPRINYFMNVFRDRGLIEYDGCRVVVKAGLIDVVVQE